MGAIERQAEILENCYDSANKLLKTTGVGGSGGVVTTPDGGNVAMGTTTDAAVTDPTDAGTLVALFKGLLKNLNTEKVSTKQRATGSGAVSVNVAPAARYLLKEVRIHLSAVGASGTLSIDVDNNAGSAYDLNLLAQDMTSVKDLRFVLDEPLEAESTDQVNITWANAGGKTYGVEVLYALY